MQVKPQAGEEAAGDGTQKITTRRLSGARMLEGVEGGEGRQF